MNREYSTVRLLQTKCICLRADKQAKKKKNNGAESGWEGCEEGRQ